MAGSGDEIDSAGAGSDEHELLPLRSMDDPCTERLRLCRLFAYLRKHGYGELCQAARRTMPLIFHTRDLAKKVKQGKWGEATFYVNSFAPFLKSGYEARLLMQFLMDFNALDAFARDGCVSLGGTYFWNWLKGMYKKPVLDKYPCLATIVEDIVLYHNDDDHARAFLDWQLVRSKAAKVAKEMAYKTPELRSKMRYPRGRSDLYHVVPVGSRRCVKKNFARKQSAALAHYYLKMKKRMKKRLPSSILPGEPLSIQKMLHGEQLLALFEKTLEAGRDRRNVHLPKEAMKRAILEASRRYTAQLGNPSNMPDYRECE